MSLLSMTPYDFGELPIRVIQRYLVDDCSTFGTDLISCPNKVSI